MRRLEEKYAAELVVIGVHSAKFHTESDTRNIRGAILRHGLEHPVVNDTGFKIWRQYGVNAWPTLVLIGPDGRIVDTHAGEITFESYDPLLAGTLEEYDRQGLIDRRSLNLRREKETEPERPLYFPAKVLADPAGGRLFIADTGHHRLLVSALPDSPSGGGEPVASVRHIIGRGRPGFADGPGAEAAFNEPRGMALSADGRLFVADTENHAIRVVDLDSYSVTTIAGTGEQSRFYAQVHGAGREAPLNSPWDLLFAGSLLYIAMAGSHQIWTLDLESLELRVFAGMGREALIDGPLSRAALNQPSDLASDGRYLYIADSEASAIRRADLDPEGDLDTIVGTGLFDFGDVDGSGDTVRLQHPLGLEYWPGRPGQSSALLISDTYNNKIKLLHLEDRAVVTLLGSGERSLADGTGPEAAFGEPGGLSLADGLLFVADTDNHSIRMVNLDTREVATLGIAGLKTGSGGGADTPAAVTAAGQEEEYEEEAVMLPVQRVAPGSGIVEVSIELPPGHKLSLEENFYFGWSSDDEAVVSFPGEEGSRSGPHPELPFRVEAQYREGKAAIDLEMTIYYCPESAESLCLIDAPLLRLPIIVEPGAPDSDIRVSYTVVRED